MTAQTCHACQVTLPGVRSVIDRADALAVAAESLVYALHNAAHDFPLCDEWTATEDAIAAYRNGPTPAFTTDDNLPLCSPCYWKAASA